MAEEVGVIELLVVQVSDIGNARSTHLPEKPPSFWTFASSRSRTPTTSSGTRGVGSSPRSSRAGRLILADSLAALSLWKEPCAKLSQNMSKEDRVKYLAAQAQFHRHTIHGCTVKPVPAELVYSLNQNLADDADTSVSSSPIMKDWTVIDRLHLVRVPTFLINGRGDMAQDFVVAPFFQKISKVKWVTFENSSHTPFWEEREKFMKLVAEFLKL
ncbi:hypothetical protein BKA93DRAFT_882394 [Sparassis latifolia]